MKSKARIMVLRCWAPLAAMALPGCVVESDPAAGEAAETATDSLESTRVLSAAEAAELGFAQVSDSGFSCSGLVVSSSGFWKKSFVLTAAHCQKSASSTVVVNGKPYTGANILHPSYAFPSFDSMLIEIDAAVEVFDPSGARVLEYRRPIYQGPVSAVANKAGAIFGSGRTDGAPDERCDPVGTGASDGLVRWAEYPALSNGDPDTIAVPQASLIPAGSRWHKGDSGGPWLFADGTTASTLSDYSENGVVIGVANGMFCTGIGRDEAQGTGTHPPATGTFLSNNMGGFLSVVSDDDLPWSRNDCWNPWTCVYTDLERAALTYAVL